MKDDHKTKKQLIDELTELRSQYAVQKESITGSISAELVVEEARRYAESIVETVREPLLVLDADLKIISANRNFYRTFKVTPGETIGSFIYDLGNKQWDIPKLRELLEEVLPEKQAFDDFEVDHNFEDIGHKIMLLNAHQIYRKDIGSKMILLAIEDITERKEIEAGLEKTRKELAVIKIAADEVSEYAESVINTVREPLIALDQDLRVVTASRSFYNFFKVTPAETVGSLIYDLGNKQWDIPKLRELLETILPEKTTFDDYEVEHNFTTIGWRVMLLNARQIKRAFGKERIILLAIEDITERKRLENLLIDSEQQYRRLFETASDGIVLLEKREGKITQANPATEKLLGYTEKESIGKSLQDIGVVLDTSDFQTTMRNLNKSGIINYRNVKVETKSGQHVDTEIYLVDRAKLVQCNIRDITERKRAKEALKESEEKYRWLVDNMADVITVMDMNLRFTYVSPSITGMRGYTPEEAVAQTFEQVMTPESLQIIARVFEEEMQLEASGTADPSRSRILETDQYKKDGSIVCMENHLSFLRDEAQKAVGIISLTRDITERKQAEEALKESENKYRLLADNVNDVIFVLDMNLNYTYVSPSVKILRGYEPEEVLKQQPSDILTPSSLDLAMSTLSEIMGLVKNERRDIPVSKTLDLEMIRKDGTTVWTEVKFSFIRDENQQPVGILGLTRDITKRKRAEEEIIEQRNLSKKYLQVAGVMICALNSMGEITLINKRGLDILGYKDEQELLGKNWFEVSLPKNVVPDVKNVFNQLMSSNIDPVEYNEYHILTKYGEERIVAFHNTVLRDKEDKISGVLFSGEDITERKRAEEALKKSEEEFHSLAESMPQIVWITRKDGWNIYFNQQWVDYTGLTLEESYGHGWNIPFHPDDQQRAWSAWENATKNNGIYSLECRLRRADGAYRWWLVRGVPLLDETGEIIKWFGTCTDIDDIKNAEKQLQDTLDSLKRAVNTTIQVMVSAVEVRDPYTSGHQIRSADLASAIAMEMGLPQDKIDGIRMAGSIHDIGKLSIPAEILSKPKKLTEIEFSLIKEHSQKGYEMLKNVESPWPLAEIVYQHHERMDGSGYPRNLKGEEILMEARIMAVADVVESMASHRPYRPALGIDAALEEIEKNGGTHYDNTVADACLRLFREKGYKLEGT